MMTTDENVRVLVDSWKWMVSRFPAAEIKHEDGVATMFANLPLPFLNVSVLDQQMDKTSLHHAFAIAKQRAANCKYGSMLGLCEDWVPEEWERIATEQGFSRAINMTGMAADELRPPRRATPDIEFRRITDDATARDLAMINAQAYEMPQELFECIANLCLWQEDSFGYVGYAGGRAVTCAATLPVAGTIYVALVATLPEAHGKGYAEAVMRKAVEHGQKSMGALRLTLHASDMGLPLYKSMGFEPAGRMPLLVQGDGSTGH